MKRITITKKQNYLEYSKQRRFFQFLTLLFVLFIWSNSLQPASTSSSISSGIFATLQDFWIQTFYRPFPVSHHLLRKLGHFSEFLVFGVLATVTAFTEKNDSRLLKYKTLYFGLLTAFIDETIQYFSPGRSPEVTDILIDYAGFCCGFFIICLTLKILKKN